MRLARGEPNTWAARMVTMVTRYSKCYNTENMYHPIMLHVYNIVRISTCSSTSRFVPICGKQKNVLLKKLLSVAHNYKAEYVHKTDVGITCK